MGKYKVTFIFDRTYVWKMLTVVNSIIQNEKKEYADSIDFYLTYFGVEKEGQFILQQARKNFPNNGFYLKHVPTELPDLYKKYESSYESGGAHHELEPLLTCSAGAAVLSRVVLEFRVKLHEMNRVAEF